MFIRYLLIPLALALMSFDTVIDDMIDRTERQLATQTELKTLMQELQQEQTRFTEGEQTRTQASRMVALADQILKMIEESHYETLFTPSYIDELRFLSSIANKKSPAPP